MLKRKIYILILSIITSISVFMGATTIALAGEVNSVSTVAGVACTVTAQTNEFNTGDYLNVEVKSNTEVNSVKTLIYANNNVYQTVIGGFSLSLKNSNNEDKIVEFTAPISIMIDVGYTPTEAVQVITLNNNYDVEIYQATIAGNALSFTASNFETFWLVLNAPSTYTEKEVVSNSFIMLNRVINEGGFVSANNYVKYYNISRCGLDAFASLTNEDKLLYETEFNSLLRYYKLANIELLNALYNPNDYSNTENGTIAINNLKALTVSAIEQATSKGEVDAIVSSFKNQLATGGYSKKLSTVSTSEEGYEASVYAFKTVDGAEVENLAFSNDAKLTVVDVKNEVLIKNTQIALKKTDGVVENGGVYKYINVKVTENGVIDEKQYEKLVITVSLESLGLTVEDGEVIQIAKYLKNQTVEIINATVISGKLVFETSQFGEYAIVKTGYALENDSAFLAFFADYGLFVAIGAGVILVIIILISISSANKKRKEKRAFKAFKKAQKKNANLSDSNKSKRKR